MDYLDILREIFSLVNELTKDNGSKAYLECGTVFILDCLKMDIKKSALDIMLDNLLKFSHSDFLDDFAVLKVQLKVT